MNRITIDVVLWLGLLGGLAGAHAHRFRFTGPVTTPHEPPPPVCCPKF